MRDFPLASLLLIVSRMPLLNTHRLDFLPALVIFDKDGTLIDFNFMWAEWVVTLAQRLELATGLPVSHRLYEVMGFDPVQRRVLADGPLAAHSMASLRLLSAAVLREFEIPQETANDAVNSTWLVPDPVELARPLADLPHIFESLRARGIQIAIATSDDRTPTQTTLQCLGVAPFISAVVCADDHIPLKPAPDMILSICRSLAVSPARTMVLGDSVADLQMGRAAGCGMVVGVSSGVTPADKLSPFADTVISSVSDLI